MYALARKYPARHQARQDRHDAPGPRDPRAEGHAGRPRPADGSRPAVLFSATQHAREWIASEIDRRLMYHYVEGWANDDKQIKELLKSTELWFVPIMNPDGYQYTFTNERLWRKNLRDNDGDGQTTNADGVDPNRNYPEHFKYDEEGSSKIHSSQTYRGPGPASEAETQAIMGLSETRRLRVQRQLPLQRPLAAVPGGLADQLADVRRPDLLRAVGQPRPAGDRGLPPGPELGRPLRHQRRGQRLPAQAGRRAGLDPGAEPGLPVVRVRVPRRRGAGPGGVRAQPAVRRVGRELRGGPG